MGDILLKIHKSSRWVVAICDKEIFGRKLEEGKIHLDVSTEFFNGELLDEEEIKNEMQRCMSEDATFNIVGERSIKLATELELIDSNGVMIIDKVPFALVLL